MSDIPNESPKCAHGVTLGVYCAECTEPRWLQQLIQHVQSCSPAEQPHALIGCALAFADGLAATGRCSREAFLELAGVTYDNVRHLEAKKGVS